MYLWPVIFLPWFAQNFVCRSKNKPSTTVPSGRPGVLRFMGSQRVRHDWATELTDGLIISFSTLKIDAHVLLSTSSNSSYSESFQYDIMLSIRLHFLLFLKPHPVFKLYLCSTLKFKRSFRNLIFLTINKVGMIVHFIEILQKTNKQNQELLFS